MYAAERVARKIYQIAPNDARVQVFRAVDLCTDRAYHKAIQLGQKLLNVDLSLEDQLRLYQILCFSLYQIRQLPEALSYAIQGLELAPEDYKLRCHRAVVYRMLGQHQEAKADLEIASENAPDEDSC